MTSKKQQLKRWEELTRQVRESTIINPLETDREQQDRIERAKRDYRYFVNYYFPHYAKVDCADFHIRAANKIRKNQRIRAVLEWFRGAAKSTHVNIFIPIWLMIQDELHVMVLVGKNEDDAKTLLSDLQAELVENNRLKHDFGDQHKHGSWEEGRFVTASGAAFFAKGRGQSPRGLRHRSRRPDYIVIDDMDDDELVENPKRTRKLLDWTLTALFGTMDVGRGRFVMVGNRIHKESVLAMMVDSFRHIPGFHHERVNLLDSKGRPSWPEKYTIKEAKVLISEIGTRRAQKEFFNNPISEGSLFHRDWIRWKRMRSFKEYSYLVAYTDPSFKNTPTSDFKATVLLGLKGKEIHIIKAYVDQTTTSQMISWWYDIRDSIKDNVVTFHLEANMLQDYLFRDIKDMEKKRGFPIPVIPDKRKKPDKFIRIESITGYFERGLVLFNEDEKNNPHMMRLIDQFLMMEKGSRAPDDGPDAVEGAMYILSQKVASSTLPIVGRRPANKFKF